MIHPINQIVLFNDELSTSRFATESALNLARQHNAKVKIIDAVREPSSVSQWFSPNASEVFEMVLVDKRKRLNAMSTRFNEVGVEATCEVLIEKTSVAITRAAIEAEADIVVRYMKGIRSRSPGLFGNTSRNLMRICPCPVLFVNDKEVDHPKVLACINAEHDPTENETILRACEMLTADANQSLGVYCWDLHGKEIMQNHVSAESLKDLLSESERLHQSAFEKTLKLIELGAFAGKIRMENGSPSEIIPQLCRDESVDVAVMCSASLNHPIHRFLGSTIESVLDQLPCSLMVVKPTGFKSPISSSKASEKVT